MKRTLIISAIVFFVFISTLIFEVFLATKGEREDFRNPPNEPRFFGEGGKKLTYLVIGDSTSAGQGGDYEKGVAVSSAKYLGNNYKVEMINFSVSGATVEDVKNNQLNKALQYVPDIVLISAGSNDVTHLSSTSKIKKNLNEIVDKLIEKNCNVKIIVTGSADFGSVPRFLQPLRWVAGLRTKYINNKVFYPIINEKDLILAPIAKETGPIFRKDKSLFAKDRYHPNDDGYAVWNKVIEKSLVEATISKDNCINRGYK